MNRVAKKYWPRLIAAAVVLICVMIFNLQEYRASNESVFSYSYGWPFVFFRVINDVFSIRVGGSTGQWQYSALALNLIVGSVLIAIAPLGIWQLQRINGQLIRFHLQSMLLVVLAAALLLWLNLEQKTGSLSWRLAFRHAGWPHDAFLWYSENFDLTFVNPQLSISAKALARNIFVAAYACFTVWVVSESLLAWRMRKKSNQ